MFGAVILNRMCDVRRNDGKSAAGQIQYESVLNVSRDKQPLYLPGMRCDATTDGEHVQIKIKSLHKHQSGNTSEM